MIHDFNNFSYLNLFKCKNLIKFVTTVHILLCARFSTEELFSSGDSMAKETKKGFDIEDLSSLISLILGIREDEPADRDMIEENKAFIKKWHIKGHRLFTQQQIMKKRELITMGAMECSIGKETVWVWAAVDLKDKMIINIQVSHEKNETATYNFLKSVAKLCKKPLPRVFVNTDTWDRALFEKAGFKYGELDFETGDVAETFLSIVNERMCKFVHKVTDKKTLKNIRWWIEGFAVFINYWTARR